MKHIILTLGILGIFSLTNCNENSVPVSTQTDTTKKTLAIKKVTSQPLHITFASQDSLIISADSYFQNDSLPWIILCHQAGYSRGEYKETAPKFEALGFNCLAIDQRSGEEVNGIKNETAARAKEQGKPTEYLDAEQDIIAAMNYLYNETKKPVILLGSSYSAGLVLKIAVNNPKVKAVLAFSPGEYYGDKLNLVKSVTPLDKPVFISSAKSELKEALMIYECITSKQKTLFSPISPGVHASSCLWESTNDYKEYWTAVEFFLVKNK